jgi:hypothetical protein
MEINSTVKKSEDEGFLEMPAEGLDAQLDDILDEVVNLAATVEAENSILDNIVADGEEAVDETDFAMQTGDYLELEIDLPMEATEPQAKITPLAEETESALDALDDQLSEDLPVDSEMEQDSKEDNVSFAKAPSIAEKSSEELLGEVELENVLEAGQTNAGGTSRLSASDDELAALITEKMEAFVTSLVEERMSAIVERIITEKITNIFAFMK